jgi:hypothetical protein
MKMKILEIKNNKNLGDKESIFNNKNRRKVGVNEAQTYHEWKKTFLSNFYQDTSYSNKREVRG